MSFSLVFFVNLFFNFNFLFIIELSSFLCVSFNLFKFNASGLLLIDVLELFSTIFYCSFDLNLFFEFILFSIVLKVILFSSFFLFELEV